MKKKKEILDESTKAVQELRKKVDSGKIDLSRYEDMIEEEPEESFDIDEVIQETKERIDEVNEINQKPKSWFKKRNRTR